MAVDTPATVAIIGAGPIGLEAALYGRYLGYDVLLFDRGAVAADVQRWGHARLYTPFGECVSKLGLAALHAQDAAWRPPAPQAQLTGHAWRDAYLLPLAHSDLLVDGLHEFTEVVAVQRKAPSATASDDEDDDNRDYEPAFCLRVRSSRDSHAEHEVLADVVIDASGLSGRPAWMSGEDEPAPGEVAAAGLIDYGIPDLLGCARSRYAGRRILLVGGSVSALINVAALAELRAAAPDTEIVWVTPPNPAHDAVAWPAANDPSTLASPWRALATAAKRLASETTQIQHVPDAKVESLSIGAGGAVCIRLRGALASEIRCERIIANMGSRAGESLFKGRPLPVYPATNASLGLGPAGESGSAAGHADSVCYQIAQELAGGESDSYVLGSKRFGRRGDRFTVAGGLNQVRALYTIIADRPSLDLYATMTNLLP